MFVLHCQQEDSGTWQARLETHVQHPSPEQNILAILDEIERLPEDLREIWAGCSQRNFSLGYECGGHRGRPSMACPARRSARRGRRRQLTITLYAPEEPGAPSGPAVDAGPWRPSSHRPADRRPFVLSFAARRGAPARDPRAAGERARRSSERARHRDQPRTSTWSIAATLPLTEANGATNEGLIADAIAATLTRGRDPDLIGSE